MNTLDLEFSILSDNSGCQDESQNRIPLSVKQFSVT